MPDAKKTIVISKDSAPSEALLPCARESQPHPERPSEFGPQGAPNDPLALAQRLSEKRVLH